jgi:hypothetical protein
MKHDPGTVAAASHEVCGCQYAGVKLDTSVRFVLHEHLENAKSFAYITTNNTIEGMVGDAY